VVALNHFKTPSSSSFAYTIILTYVTINDNTPGEKLSGGAELRLLGVWSPVDRMEADQQRSCRDENVHQRDAVAREMFNV
jgi:hypothetical protein